MTPITTIENISFDNWCNLLNNAHSKHYYIYERQDNKELVICEKNTNNTDNLKKLSLNSIVNKCYAFQNTKNFFSHDTIKSINDIKLRTNQKNYATSFKLKILFDSTINWISNDEFLTDVNRIDNFILFNKKIDAQNHIEHLENDSYKNHTQRNKKKIGSGLSGSVYHHKTDDTIVVKESTPESLEREFELGFILDTPYVAKSKKMYVWKGNGYGIAQVLMEKIVGKTAKYYVEHKSKININKSITVLENAKECCLDLFRQKIVWADLNGGNLFITEKGLKICDLGHWEMREEEKVRGRLLLIGAMQLVDMVIQIVTGIKGTQKHNAITYPNSFFGKEWGDDEIWCHFTLGRPLEESYIPDEMDEIINKKLSKAENIEEVITDYFSSVIKNLSDCLSEVEKNIEEI